MFAKLRAFLNSSNIPACLDQAIQTRKPSSNCLILLSELVALCPTKRRCNLSTHAPDCQKQDGEDGDSEKSLDYDELFPLVIFRYQDSWPKIKRLWGFKRDSPDHILYFNKHEM